MPLSATAFATIEELRAFCLRDAADDTRDDLLIPLANGYSKQIARYCQRQFFPETGDTKTFTYNGSGFFDLAPYDLRTDDEPGVTVRYAGGAATTLVRGTDYSLEPAGESAEGTYLWMRLPVLNNPGAIPGGSPLGLMWTLEVDGNWGIEDWRVTCEDLNLALLMAVEWRYKNPSGQASVSVGGLVETAYPVQGGKDAPAIPQEALAMLNGIRRPEAGV